MAVEESLLDLRFGVWMIFNTNLIVNSKVPLGMVRLSPDTVYYDQVFIPFQHFGGTNLNCVPLFFFRDIILHFI